MTYDGTYAATDKILAFIQQFDSAFGGEEFDEGSKLRHVAMYLQKSARKWWASLSIIGQTPKTWKECRKAIMNQFLTEHAQDDVMAEWRSLYLEKGETINKYIDRFWDLYLKACVFEEMGFQTQKQQYCAGLPEDMRAYVNAQKPQTISAVIHHSMLAYKNFHTTPKVASKPVEKVEKSVEKPPAGNNKKPSFVAKKQDKKGYKGNNRLTPKELERYKKENRCFQCSEQGHALWNCPKKNQGNGMKEAP